MIVLVTVIRYLPLRQGQVVALSSAQVRKRTAFVSGLEPFGDGSALCEVFADGSGLKPGEVFGVPGDVADRLHTGGFASMIVAAASEPESNDQADLLCKIMEAVACLSPEDFTRSGKPRVDTVRTMLSDESITREDITAAMGES